MDSSGKLRVSDAERDQAVSRLSEHFQAGRLTMEEFDERSDQALRAKTRADIATLFTDLPSGPPKAPPVPVNPAPPVRSSFVPALIGGAALVAFTVVTLGIALNTHGHVVIVAPVILWLLVFRHLARAAGRQRF
jgi:Flp pilus assembly protein TadB